MTTATRRTPWSALAVARRALARTSPTPPPFAYLTDAQLQAALDLTRGGHVVDLPLFDPHRWPASRATGFEHLTDAQVALTYARVVARLATQAQGRIPPKRRYEAPDV